jgi:hypothetical protein
MADATESRTRSPRVVRSLALVAVVLIAGLGGLVSSASPANAATCSDGGLGGWWYNPNAPATVTDIGLGLVCGSEVYFNVYAYGSCASGTCYLGNGRTQPYGSTWLRTTLRSSGATRTVYIRKTGSASFPMLEVVTYTTFSGGGTAYADETLIPSS